MAEKCAVCGHTDHGELGLRPTDSGWVHIISSDCLAARTRAIAEMCRLGLDSYIVLEQIRRAFPEAFTEVRRG